MGANGWKEAKEELGKFYVEFCVNYKSYKRMEIKNFDQSSIIKMSSSTSSEKTNNEPVKKNNWK